MTRSTAWRRSAGVDGAAGWQPWTAWAAIVVSIGLIVGARSFVPDEGGPRLGGLVALILLTLAPVGLVILLARWQGLTTAADFGLQRPPLLRATGLVMAAAAFAFASTVLFGVVVGIDDPNSADRFGARNDTLNAVLVIVLLAVASPLGEEFLFRGYFFRTLTNWRGVWPAVTATTVVFTATHVGWVPTAVLILVAVYGLGYCLLYLWSGSLYPGLALHALFNSASIGTLPAWSVPLPVTMAASVAVTLAIARLIAIGLGRRTETLRDFGGGPAVWGSRAEAAVVTPS